MKDNDFYVGLSSLGSSWQEGLLILMYHAIETPPLRHPWRALYVEPEKLEAQVRELQESGLTFVSLTQWNQNRTDARQVALTFDDGFQNMISHALPVLQKLAVPAITYVVAKRIGQTNEWDRTVGAQMRPFMTRSDIQCWLDAGLEIGSHTLTHPHLTSLSLSEARHEIFESKKILEDISGRSVLHFCYPYGDWNPAIRDLVAEAGYLTACTTQVGTNLVSTDSFGLRRMLARHQRPYAVALGRAFQRVLQGKSLRAN